MLLNKDYKFWFCTGSQDLYGEECQIKNTLMRLPIASDQSRAIHAEHNRKILDTDIVNDLIICPL